MTGPKWSPSRRETEVGGYAVTGPEGQLSGFLGGNFGVGDRGLKEVLGFLFFGGF